ncbi:lactonase family protein [Streptococcus sp. H49]|uniref:lactonase family protein n=1 Tax=Streptococcus huangxiaojuni TaxID=3237239 RepID=UPI0034A43B64
METIYFGTYTKRQSQGIYSADFDTKDGRISNLQLAAEEVNPTYLAFSDSNCYSVGSYGGMGGIANFDSRFQLINHVVEEGAALCYVAVDKGRRLVYGANYHKGEVCIYKQNNQGQLTLANKIHHHGSGPHKNQASPHPHFADLTPDNYLVTCDLGTDSVTTYAVTDSGQAEKIANYQAAPGAGSRHLVFHPDGKTAYLVCELNASVEVLNYRGQGKFEKQQTAPTLPADYKGFNACGAIRITKDGRFLYVSNRGHDSIAVFAILTDGRLEKRQIISSAGQTPRDFCLSPKEDYLIVVHQDSDNAAVFRRDSKTGLLVERSHDFTVPEAVCVLFNDWKEK